ncbi:sensor histidine kinase [Verrucomicrobiota bacterium sgz303538]
MAAAAAVLGTGTWMARRTVEERIPIDRTVLREFTEALDGELSRLQDLYEQDLREVAGALSSATRLSARQQCGSVYGIRSCAFVPLKLKVPPVAIVISTDATDRVPSVLARSSTLPSAPSREIFLIDTVAVSSARQAGGAPTGWMHHTGTPFSAFWMRNGPDEVVVLVIDWRQVTARTNLHLRQWITAPYAAVRATGDPVALEGPGDHLLAGLSTAQSKPADFIFPIRKRQGQWQLQAWDRTEMRLRYDLGTLGAAATGSVILIIIGLVLFRHQQDALRLAEARVSFVNRVSHELGTPLTNMLLNLDLADEQLRSSPEGARQHLHLVTQETERLSRLVKNVLTFSKAERNDLNLAPKTILPDEVISAVLKQFAPALQRRGVIVEWKRDASIGVTLDPDALAQIVGNLVSNVEKYASKGKWLNVESSWKDGILSVQVSDDGPGISERDRIRIFRAFERVHSSLNEGASGTGLGLAIARDLALRMGGSLELLPSTKGALFELRIPALPAITPFESAQPAA